MKTFFFLFMVCAVCCVGASAQISGSIANSQPQMFTMPDHFEHASQVGLATSQNLMERSGSVSYQGERPLWEVAPSAPVVPLGDLAREARKEHVSAKKAVRVWMN